jgi:hypothetical protein
MRKLNTADMIFPVSDYLSSAPLSSDFGLAHYGLIYAMDGKASIHRSNNILCGSYIHWRSCTLMILCVQRRISLLSRTCAELLPSRSPSLKRQDKRRGKYHTIGHDPEPLPPTFTFGTYFLKTRFDVNILYVALLPTGVLLEISPQKFCFTFPRLIR